MSSRPRHRAVAGLTAATARPPPRRRWASAPAAPSTTTSSSTRRPRRASAAVLSFLSGWASSCTRAGYLAGMYSSGSSGIKDVCPSTTTRATAGWTRSGSPGGTAWPTPTAARTPRRVLGEPPAAAPVRRGRHRDLGRRDDEHRPQLPRRGAAQRRRSSGAPPSTTPPRAGSPRARTGAPRPTPASGSAPTTGSPTGRRPATSPGTRRTSRRPEATRSRSGTRRRRIQQPDAVPRGHHRGQPVRDGQPAGQRRTVGLDRRVHPRCRGRQQGRGEPVDHRHRLRRRRRGTDHPRCDRRPPDRWERGVAGAYESPLAAPRCGVRCRR